MDIVSKTSNSKVSFWLFLALMGTSLEPVLVKHFNPQISPLGLIVLKSLAGGIIMSPLYKSLRKITRSEMKPLLLVSALAFLTNGLIFLSLEYLPATILITVITTTPLLVALINHRKGLLHFNWKFLGSFIGVLVGVILTIKLKDKYHSDWSYVGLLIAFTSVITSACYRVKMDSLTQIISPRVISGGIFGINSIASLCFLPFVDIPKEVYPLGVWLGLAGAIANIAFLTSIKFLGSTRVSILSIIQRPFAVIIGAFTLNEVLSPSQMLGMGLIFGGVFFAKFHTDPKKK